MASENATVFWVVGAITDQLIRFRTYKTGLVVGLCNVFEAHSSLVRVFPQNSGLSLLAVAALTYFAFANRLVQTIASSQGWLDEIIHVLVVGFEQDSDALPPAWFCDNDAAIVTTFNTIPPCVYVSRSSTFKKSVFLQF